MRRHVVVDIEACPEHVWAVLSDVSRWPEWTGAVQEVQLLDAAVLGPGSVVRVRAPGLPEREWRVSAYARHRSFTWSAEGLGGGASVRFGLERRPEAGRTRVRVDHERHGWVAGAVAYLTKRTVARTLRDLADGLRRRCERRPGPGRAPTPSPPSVTGITPADG